MTLEELNIIITANAEQAKQELSSISNSVRNSQTQIQTQTNTTQKDIQKIVATAKQANTEISNVNNVASKNTNQSAIANTQNLVPNIPIPKTSTVKKATDAEKELKERAAEAQKAVNKAKAEQQKQFQKTQQNTQSLSSLMKGDFAGAAKNFAKTAGATFLWITLIVEGVKKGIELAKQALQSYLQEQQRLKDIGEPYDAESLEAFQRIAAITKKTMQEIGAIVAKALVPVLQALEPALYEFRRFISILEQIPGLTDNAFANWVIILDFIAANLYLINELLEKMFGVKGVVDEIKPEEGDGELSSLDEVSTIDNSSIYEKTIDQQKEIQIGNNKFLRFVATIATKIKEIFQSLVDWFVWLFGEFGKWTEDIKTFFNNLGNWFSEIGKGVQETLQKVWDWFGGIFDSIKSGFVGIGESLKNFWDSIGTNFNKVFVPIQENLNKFWADISTKFQNFWQSVGKGISDIFEKAINGIINGINWVVDNSINALIRGVNLIPGVDIPEIPKIPNVDFDSNNNTNAQSFSEQLQIPFSTNSTQGSQIQPQNIQLSLSLDGQQLASSVLQQQTSRNSSITVSTNSIFQGGY